MCGHDYLMLTLGVVEVSVVRECLYEQFPTIPGVISVA
jgi:hypothetical protein